MSEEVEKLVERLKARRVAGKWPDTTEPDPLCQDAAATLERVERERDEARDEVILAASCLQLADAQVEALTEEREEALDLAAMWKTSQDAEVAAHGRSRAQVEAMRKALEWIEVFAQVRAKDDSKTFARVNRAALRTIAEKAAALSAPAEESGSQPGWRPIETAPKDGTDVLLWAQTDEELGCSGLMDMAYWVRGEGWVVCSPGLNVNFSRNPDIYTHWMPLPAAPAEARSDACTRRIVRATSWTCAVGPTPAPVAWRAATMADLAELLEWVKANDGPNRTLDLAIAQALGQPWSCKDNPPSEPGGEWWPSQIRCDRFTASLDAALALVERVLPETVPAPREDMPLWLPKIGRWFNGQWEATLYRSTDGFKAEASAPTRALALLAALLSALAPADVGSAYLNKEA